MKFAIGFIFYILISLHVLAQAVSAAKGKEIFTTRCTACHSIATEVVGPALKDVGKRRSEQWIIAFVHSSQTVIKSGDAVAVKLFDSHNRTVMPDQTDLSAGDIRNIIAYISEVSARLASQPLNGFTPDEPPPYAGKSNLLHQLIFLDVSGNHRPLSAKDFWPWVLIFTMVFLLILALSVAVRTQGIVHDFNKHNNDTK